MLQIKPNMLVVVVVEGGGGGGGGGAQSHCKYLYQEHWGSTTSAKFKQILFIKSWDRTVFR